MKKKATAIKCRIQAASVREQQQYREENWKVSRKKKTLTFKKHNQFTFLLLYRSIAQNYSFETVSEWVSL